MSIKTDKYYLEQVWAPIIACIAGSINLICPNILSCKDPSIVVSKIIDISFIVFGFLLTILALILQSNQEIRKRKLYPRLIKLNKRILYIALASGGTRYFIILSLSRSQIPFLKSLALLYLFCFSFG